MPTLFQAAGNDWRLEIVGKLPELPPFLHPVPDTAITVQGSAALETFDAQKQLLVGRRSGERIAPLFFEAVEYDIHLERKDESVTIALPPAAELRRSRPTSQHYRLNFGNNVGFAAFSVNTGKTSTAFRVEVFSRKADYRTDYLRMRDDVSGVLRNLAMAANAKTFGLAAPSKDHRPTLLEWFALVEAHFGDFIKLAGAIGRAPRTALRAKMVLVRTEKARRVSRSAINRALLRNNGGIALPHLPGIALPRKLNETVSFATFDTPENRYYKAMLLATYRNMRSLSRTSTSGDEDADWETEHRFFDYVRPKLKAMERQLERALREPFLANVATAPAIRPASMALHKHPLYSRFDKLCQLFNGGLSFAGNIVPIGTKDTALLYEYWCFLSLIGLLRKHFDLVEQSVVRVERLRTVVMLAKGRTAAMRFLHRPTGKHLYVVYNRLFTRLPTLAQKPDNVIQFATDDRFYIFDAKYRLQFDADYLNLYGGPGPTADDINTMHRYRDAIVIPHPMKPLEFLKGVVLGAVVLFPYPDEAAYKNHRFYKSIGHVEIGGLPFLPKATQLVEQKVRSLLAAEYASPGA